jgi:hypothetical protein
MILASWPNGASQIPPKEAGKTRLSLCREWAVGSGDFQLTTFFNWIISRPSVQGIGSDMWFRRDKMTTLERSLTKKPKRPYRPLRDDPRYGEIKKMIEEFPSEHMEKLKLYIQRWLRAS